MDKKPLFVRKSSQNMTHGQITAKQIFMDKIKSGKYKEISTKCLCGADEDLLLAEEDRYGIPFHTVICKKCGMMRANPYYSADTIAEFYANEYSPLYRELDSCDEGFWKKYLEYGNERVKWIEQKIGSLSGKKVYEIGCGSGATLFCFKQRGAEVYGCDFGEKFMQFGKEKGINILCGEWPVLKQYGKADVVVINHVLEHIANPLEYLKKIKEVMKEDTCLYIGVPFISQIEVGVYEYDLFRYIQNAHAWYFSERTLSALLKAAGYQIIDIKASEYIMCTPQGKEEEYGIGLEHESSETIAHLECWDRTLDAVLKYKEKLEEEKKKIEERRAVWEEEKAKILEERMVLLEECSSLREIKQELLEKCKKENEKYITALNDRKKAVEEKNALLDDRKKLRENVKALKEEIERLKKR